MQHLQAFFFFTSFLSRCVLSSFIFPPAMPLGKTAGRRMRFTLSTTLNPTKITLSPNGCTLAYCKKNDVEAAAVEFKEKS